MSINLLMLILWFLTGIISAFIAVPYQHKESRTGVSDIAIAMMSHAWVYKYHPNHVYQT